MGLLMLNKIAYGNNGASWKDIIGTLSAGSTSITLLDTSITTNSNILV